MLEELIDILGWQGGTKHQALEQVRQLVSDSYKFKAILTEVIDSTVPHNRNECSDGLGHCIDADLWRKIRVAVCTPTTNLK